MEVFSHGSACEARWCLQWTWCTRKCLPKHYSSFWWQQRICTWRSECRLQVYRKRHAKNATLKMPLYKLLLLCRYLSGCSFQDLEIVQRPFASWLIDFSEDTTTTPSYCAYDRYIIAIYSNWPPSAVYKNNVRIIALGDTRDHVVPCSAQVYRFDRNLSLSQDLVSFLLLLLFFLACWPLAGGRC